MTNRELDRRIRMIIQAYKAEILDRFQAWEEIQSVIAEWKKSRKDDPDE